MVLGLEGDVSYANLKSSGVVTALRPCLPGATGCSANLNWFGTGRARLGYADGALLTFVTGGAAVGHVQGSTVAAACGGTPTCAFDETRWGWTAGAGVEWNFNATWSAKVEYLYINLGTPSFTAAPVTTSVLTYNVVRGGVNLHF
jgi:outer membrane immunogenic protein